MGKVIGPSDPSKRYIDFLTLKLLKESIAYLKETDYSKYRVAIEKEISLYKTMLAEYVGNIPEENAA